MPITSSLFASGLLHLAGGTKLEFGRPDFDKRPRVDTVTVSAHQSYMLHDHEPRFPEERDRSRLYGTLAYLAILATCLSGYANAPWWTALCGTVALTLISQFEHKHLHDRADEIGAGWEAFKIGTIPSIRNAAIASTAAYVFGHVMRIVGKS